MANKRKCKQCGEYFKEGIKTPAGFFCSTSHAIEFAKEKQKRDFERKKKKAIASQRKVEKVAKIAKKEARRKDLSWQHKLTQKSFNRMRVLEELLWFKERGLEPTCISCGKPLGGDQWCCGHFKTRGAHPELRYDRRNTFLQHNHRCNMNLSGDIEGTKTTRGYKQGLIDRFGEVEGNAILSYCESKNEPVKWGWQDLENLRDQCNARIRELEKVVL